MKQAMLPGTEYETLPLFSGTAQREPERTEIAPKTLKQAGFFSCSVCFDTGIVKTGGKARRCWCQG